MFEKKEVSRLTDRQSRRHSDQHCSARCVTPSCIVVAAGLTLGTLQIDTIDFTEIQKTVFEQLNKGTEYLKSLQKEMSIERVEALMEDTQEALEYQKEVDQILSKSLTPEEDAAAELEYEQLEKEWAAEDLENVVGRKVQPAAASATNQQQRKVDVVLAQQSSEIDDELAELENELPSVSNRPIKTQTKASTFGGPPRVLANQLMVLFFFYS